MTSAARLMALDSASLYYRAFFGVPDSLRAPDGTVVNAVRGLLDFITTLVTQYRPDAVVACWDDAWRPAWRVDLLESYKTHRLADPAGLAEETPELLTPQVPLIAEALALLGIPVLGAPDAEADDVLGSLVATWDGPVDVVTGDRDLFQLVDDTHGTRVLYTARGVSKHDVVDEAWVRAKYGIAASRYVDFAVMRGDPSDGIPGVPGIGEKTAASLLAEFGDLDGILTAATDETSTIKPRVRASLIASADYIAAARQVVAVRQDVLEAGTYAVVPLADDARQAFEAFATTWGLHSAGQRVLSALDGVS